MHAYLGFCLTLSAFGGFVLPLPVPQSQHPLDMEVTRSSEFQDATDSALSLVTKILGEIPAVHKSLIHTTTLSLDESDLSELQFLKEFLGLPELSLLQPPSKDFTVDVSLGHIAEGLKLHKILLKVITEQKHFESNKPSGILYDLRDTLFHVHKMQHLLKASNGPEKVSETKLRQDLAPKLKNSYMSQVAAHLALIQLREFSKDVSRSLKGLIISSEEHEVQDS